MSTVVSGIVVGLLAIQALMFVVSGARSQAKDSAGTAIGAVIGIVCLCAAVALLRGW